MANVEHEPEENSPVKQVALTVSTTDDESLLVLTFQMWVLGSLSCVLLSFLNQFFGLRKEPLTVSAISSQIAVVPLGKLMAATITNREFFKGTRLEFTLNPGPFNVKEHVLSGIVYAILIVTSVKVLGFGWAGIYRRYLVESAAMWWPANLVQVSLFRALHEKEKRKKGAVTRTQFFFIAVICSFAYYIFPGYLFQMLTSLSWICWTSPKSVLAQQLGSGLSGLGLFAFGLDWATISSYLGSPLASPWFATANVAVGYVFVVYILTPICYWLNVFNAKTFPIFSQDLFSSTGQDFHLDTDAYCREGPLYISTFFSVTYGVGFASLAAIVVQVALFHGRDIWEQSKSSFQEKTMDIHTKLMRKYKQVPELWFLIILIATMGLSLFACEYYKDQLQLPWWGVLLACGIAFFFTLPIGIIAAITNQTPGINIITEYTYGYISMAQAVTFLQDFKLGRYMKIPPRTMFMAQVVGTLISGLVYLSTAWWLIENIPNIWMDETSVWSCPSNRTFYAASVIWGLVSPRRIFGNLGTYEAVNWLFLGGAIAPILVWLATKAFPKQKWIRLINMPVLIGATGSMPPATAVNYTSWILLGFLFGFVVYKPDWWRRHNYVLSGALDAGLAFMAVLIYFCLGMEEISLNWWGNNLDGCPLATCPTAKGVVVDGCPLF
ncbi:hypothetical protein ACB092_01G149900 [Castanea dentata]